MQSPQMDATVLAAAERYRTLLEINNAIITNLTQESLLNAICEAIQPRLPSTIPIKIRCAFWLFQRSGIQIIFRSELRRAEKRAFRDGYWISNGLLSAETWKKSGNTPSNGGS